jgi:hypothetical protein
VLDIQLMQLLVCVKYHEFQVVIPLQQITYCLKLH